PCLSLRWLQGVVDPHQRQELPRSRGVERQRVEVCGGLTPVAHLIRCWRIRQKIDWSEGKLAPGCLGKERRKRTGTNQKRAASSAQHAIEGRRCIGRSRASKQLFYALTVCHLYPQQWADRRSSRA